MSLSPLDSFKSRFVNYLLNLPRKKKSITMHGNMTVNNLQDLYTFTAYVNASSN